MWKCHKCGKPVFFAERKVSIGKDWHPECLRCQECGKRLNPGQHAEHKGIPYCHVPCYAALFGPQLFGHGTRVESHKSYGTPNANIPKQPALPRDHVEAKLKLFNDYYDKKSQKIKSREVNGRLVFEGPLRVYWGVAGVIHLKEDCDQRTVVLVRKRNSWRNGRDLSSDKLPLINTDPMTTSNSSMTLHDDNDTTISESLSYDTLSLASDLQSLTSAENSPLHAPHITNQPSNLDIKDVNWKEIDDMLRVEQPMQPDIHSPLPSSRENSMYHSFTESSLSAYEQITSDEQKTPVDDSSVTSLYEDYATPQNTFKPSDFEGFQENAEKEYIHEANLMPNVNDGTLKANQPIDPARINDSLKLYGDSVMTKSMSEAKPIQVLALPKANLLTGMLDPCKINDTFDRFKTSLEVENGLSELHGQEDQDTTLKHPLNLALIKNKLQQHENNINNDTDTSTTITPDDETGIVKYSNGFDSNDDSDTDTLKPHPNSTRTVYLKMDCYDDESNNKQSTETTVTTTDPNDLKGYVNEDGVVLRKPPKIGSTAIKRRSGNRRSRTRLKRRCSINGHFYNRETSFFTPPRGSQMNVWVTSLTNTKEIVSLLLEKYKVESKAEHFSLYVIKDNGEQRRVKDDEFPLVTRIMLGPYEDVARIFLMDSNVTPEISNEVAQFLNLSIPELQAILAKFSDEEERELEKIRLRYAELHLRIQSRMESLKVRL